jgi:hypothetical protein
MNVLKHVRMTMRQLGMAPGHSTGSEIQHQKIIPAGEQTLCVDIDTIATPEEPSLKSDASGRYLDHLAVPRGCAEHISGPKPMCHHQACGYLSDHIVGAVRQAVNDRRATTAREWIASERY